MADRIPVASTATRIYAADAQGRLVEIPLLRQWIDVELEQRDGAAFGTVGAVDTGAYLSVVPHSIHHQYDPDSNPRNMKWEKLSVQWPVEFFGVPCDLGRIEAWFPGANPADPIGPFSLIAKFPRTKVPPAVMDPEFVILGNSIMAEIEARLSLTFPRYSSLTAGEIEIP